MDNGQGLGEQLARREAAVGTGVCADCSQPCREDEGLCVTCRSPRRSRAQEGPDPYRKVWNTVEDEEGYILASVRNNSLFSPTPSILAERHRATARYCQRKASTNLGPTERLAFLKRAVTQERLANHMDAYGERINNMKRPSEFTFTVLEAG